MGNENEHSSAATASEHGGISRRTLCVGLGAATVTIGLGSLKYVGSTPVVRPPGAQDENRMVGNCIRCEKCYEICPHHVIKPSHIEDGILGMRTPQMDFSADYCNFCEEENGGYPLCAQVCPTGCFKLPPSPQAEDIIIGKASLITDWCLAYMLIGCRFCYDACPYDAIEMDDLGRPHIIDDLCNGCGACEAACVSLEDASVSAGATSRALIVVPVEE